MPLCISLSLKAQELVFSNNTVGINVGANVAFGTHFQRFGLNFNFFYINKFFQANTEVRAYFSFKNLGPKFIYNELVLSQGIVLGYGKKQTFFNSFINSVSNQTSYSHSIGYAYNAYINKIKTAQRTGIIALQFGSVSLIVENDIFAKPLLDRFRTGAFLLQYQHRDIFQAAVNCTMWTGAMGKSVRHINDNFIGNCYMDTTGGTYARYSHGLLSAQFKYNIGLSQTVQANIGVDSEKVRNAMQNKLIHDVGFVPKSWFIRNNCHIPMIDDKGEQFIYKDGQKIKKPKLYWNVFSNPNLFY
ncbi:MAG: hypothetical protein JWO32_946 [Bacteroidetes bacterium]|nr:hypothetical protein [Bacteroidota bacterium]